MAEEYAAGQPVPGTVRLMTTAPLVMPAHTADGQSSWREQLEDRPWLLSLGFVGLLGFFLLLRARRRA